MMYGKTATSMLAVIIRKRPKIKPIKRPYKRDFGVHLLTVEDCPSPSFDTVGLLISLSIEYAICPTARKITARVPRITCQSGKTKSEAIAVIVSAPAVNVALNKNFANI